MQIPASHPALPGHFPGHPVVPGVVLLETVVEALGRHYGESCRVTGFPTIKFLSPLSPGQEFEVVLTAKRPGLDGFEIRAAESRLVSGTVTHAAGVAT